MQAKKATKATTKTSAKPAAKPQVTAKAEPVKKETKVTPAKAEPVKAEIKAAPAKAEVKAAPAKAEPMKAEVKAQPVKKAPIKKPAAKKTELKIQTFLQFGENEYQEKDILAKVKTVWTKDLKKKVGDMKDVRLYIKPEDYKVYFVINGDITGSVDL